MNNDFDRLKTALADGYRFERPLGAGSMPPVRNKRRAAT